MSAAAIASAAVAPVFADPTLRAEQVTQLVLGETAAVLERAAEWRRVRAAFEGYEGWVHEGYLLEVGEDEAADWRARATGWSDGAVAATDGALVRLPLRARVALGGGGIRLPDGRTAVVVEGSVRELGEVAREAREESPERWALARFAGAPYQWGGVTPWGTDCSGLVQTTFAARGVALPRDSSAQVGCGTPVAPGAVRPGDLLFFRGAAEGSADRITHVAFAAADDTLVHATVACGGVLRESWHPGSRAAALRERLVAARRLAEGGDPG